MHIFDQIQFETILDAISELKKKPQKVHLVLHSEAMVRLKDLTYSFQLRNPYVDLILSYFIPRGETFTIKDLIKNFKKRMAE